MIQDVFGDCLRLLPQRVSAHIKCCTLSPPIQKAPRSSALSWSRPFQQIGRQATWRAPISSLSTDVKNAKQGSYVAFDASSAQNNNTLFWLSTSGLLCLIKYDPLLASYTRSSVTAVPHLGNPCDVDGSAKTWAVASNQPTNG